MTAPLPEKLNKFKDLLYAPLDLPPAPTVDLEELMRWSQSVSPDHPNQSGEIKLPNGQVIQTPEKVIRNKFGYYPWKSIWMKRNPQFVPENNGWMQDFVDKYPELVEYVKLFPLKEVAAVNLMWQEEGAPVMIHNDPEHWFGMRLYLANTRNSRCFFMPTHEPIDDRAELVTMDPNDPELTKLVDNRKRYVTYLKEAHPWILNNVRAFHGVDAYPNATGTRAVLIIHGMFGPDGGSPLDFDKLHDLLERSVAKYPDHCIWREDAPTPL